MQYEFDPSKRRAERPNWLPDWKDEASYGVSILSDEERIPMPDWGPLLWAWQFIRRNPEYLNDWRRFDALLDDEVTENGQPIKSPKYVTGVCVLGASMAYYHARRSALPGETNEQYEKRTGECPEPLHAYLERKWGIGGVYDPGRGLPAFLTPHLEITDAAAPYSGACSSLYDYLLFEMGPEFMNRLPPRLQEQVRRHDGVVYSFCGRNSLHIEVLGFDLRYDLGPQLEVAKRILADRYEATRQDDDRFNKLNMERSPAHQRKLPFLLRAYDGVWSGATHREIADILYRAQESGLRNVAEDISKAKSVMQTGFRNLLTRSAWG